MSTRSDEFRAYWSARSDGEHRSSQETDLAAEAREHLFHLDGGSSLLDFGCGAAELLAQYAPHYERVVGVDFSESMLAAARERLAAAGIGHARLIHADDGAVWGALAGETFDRMSTVAVTQFLDVRQVARFLRGAGANLAPGGRIIFFDVIDPTLQQLWATGAWKRRSTSANLAIALARMLPQAARHLTSRTDTWLGYCYSRDELGAIAQRSGLHATFVSSMRYEYRYHAVMERP